MSRLKNVGSIAIVALILAVTSVRSAEAQWLPDRNYTEGPGIRVGDLELHPGVALRAGYDSNVFRTKNDRVDSAILAVTPHLNIKTLSKQRLTQGEDAASTQPILPKVAFNLGAAATLFHYFDKLGPTNLEFDGDTSLSVLPERPVGFDLGASYSRSIRPFGAFAGFDADNLYAVDRIRPVVNLRAQSRSGVLRGTLAYAPSFDLYENNVYSYLNSRTHEISATAAWKFLPYTALLYDGAVYFQKYTDSDNDSATVLISPTNKRFQSRIGINGAVTQHFSVRGLVGYAVGIFEDKRFDDFETVIGEAALSYRVDVHSFEAGYQHNVMPSILGGWMLQDRGYVTLGTLVARAFALSLSGGIAGVRYGRLLAPDGSDLGQDASKGNAPTHDRKDIRGDAGVHAEYRVTNWLAFLADFSVLATKTDFRYSIERGLPFPAEFISFQAFGGVRVHY